jgi:hypothetical protein
MVVQYSLLLLLLLLLLPWPPLLPCSFLSSHRVHQPLHLLLSPQEFVQIH